MPQTSGLRGQIPPSSRISKEIRIADTATMCQTQDDDGMSESHRVEPGSFDPRALYTGN
jgi:hypothetical protein